MFGDRGWRHAHARSWAMARIELLRAGEGMAPGMAPDWDFGFGSQAENFYAANAEGLGLSPELILIGIGA